MKLKFRANNGNKADEESKLLANFVINNKKFLGITLSILDVRKQPVKPELIEDIVVKTNLRFYKELIEEENYNEYVDLLKKVYDGSKGTVSNRRGYILELIWCTAGTISKKTYNEKIENSKVFYNENPISSRDIDVVYLNVDKLQKSYELIELHECKACISQKVKPPVNDDDKEKLELMKNTAIIAHKEQFNCKPYIITYDYRSVRTKRRLEEMKFEIIDVVTRGQIEEIINANII